MSPKKKNHCILTTPNEHGEPISKVGGDPGDMVKVLSAT